MSCSVDIRLSRADRVYRPGEHITGKVVIDCSSGSVQHQGIQLQASGSLQMRLSEKAVGMFESMFANIKPAALLSAAIEIAPPGKLEKGKTELSFSLPLDKSCAVNGSTFFETYHGVNINVQYGVCVEVSRTVLRGGAITTGLMEFVIENPPSNKPIPNTPFDFKMCRGNTQMVTNVKDQIGDFVISGTVESTTVAIAEPIKGYLRLEKSTNKLASIDLQLVRKEDVIVDGSCATDLTEVQSIQIADGDICPNLDIPIHMILPRLYTCPNVASEVFRIEFEVNIVVVFEGKGLPERQPPMAALKFPLTIKRP